MSTDFCDTILIWRQRAVTVWLGAVVFIVIAVTVHQVGLRFNITPSLPTGLWLLSPLEQPPRIGEIICFCHSRRPEQLSAAEKTLALVLRRCRDGHAPLIKPVVAVSGDVVRIDQDRLRVNGLAVSGTRRIPDLRIEKIPVGDYTVAPGTVWAASGHHPRSYDSRYFGAIENSEWCGKVIPLLVWKRR